MNEKLKSWEGKLSEKSQNKGYRGGGVKLDALVHLQARSEPKDSRSSKTGRDVLRVSFHEKILSLTGWVQGDTLEMEISGNSAVVYRSQTGRCLSSSGPASKCKRLHLRFSFHPQTLTSFPSGDAREVEAKPGKIAFLLPEGIAND
jgi:hypothetical protein